MHLLKQQMSQILRQTLLFWFQCWRRVTGFRKLSLIVSTAANLIAAHALALDVALVINNPRDFASYSNLRIENWVE